MQDMNAIKYKESLTDKKRTATELFKKPKVQPTVLLMENFVTQLILNGTKFLLESNLSQLEEQLQPDNFYRINRHLLVNIEAVKKRTHLAGRKIETGNFVRQQLQKLL